MSAPSGERRLLELLAEAKSAIDRGDEDGAAPAIAEVEARCASLAREGIDVDPSLVAQLRMVVEECLASAAGLRSSLNGELGAAATSRRALRAYDHPGA